MQRVVQQAVQEAPGWAQGKVGATGMAEEATGKVGDTSPWVNRRGRQSTQGATGAARWSTRAQTALATPETDSKEGTSRVGTSPGFQGLLKEDSDKVEEAGTRGSKGSRVGREPWAGCSSMHRATGSQ